MNEQEKACEAIVSALKADTGRPKKVDTWKKPACEALGIKKMGEARWSMILEHGYKKNYFTLNSNVTPPCLDLPLDILGTQPVEEELEDISDTNEMIAGTNLKKTSATRVRSPQELTLKDGTIFPKEGDIVWVSSQGQVWKGEVSEITVGAIVTPLSEKDGYWGYFKADEMFDTKSQANVNKNPNKGRYWHKDSMGEKEYTLFMEYQKNRDSFLTWLNQKAEDIDLDELL